MTWWIQKVYLSILYNTKMEIPFWISRFFCHIYMREWRFSLRFDISNKPKFSLFVYREFFAYLNLRTWWAFWFTTIWIGSYCARWTVWSLAVWVVPYGSRRADWFSALWVYTFCTCDLIIGLSYLRNKFEIPNKSKIDRISVQIYVEKYQIYS